MEQLHLSSINITTDGLRRLKANSELADFTIVCGERRWKVHRALLVLLSPVLDKACSGRFKEAQEKELDLSEDGEDLVESLIHFFYTGELENKESITRPKGEEPCKGPCGCENEEALFHLRMSMLGDKYDIPVLRHHAAIGAIMNIRFIQKHDDLLELATLAHEGLPATWQVYDVIISKMARHWVPGLIVPSKRSELQTIVEAYPHLAVDVITYVGAYVKGL